MINHNAPPFLLTGRAQLTPTPRYSFVMLHAVLIYRMDTPPHAATASVLLVQRKIYSKNG
jgi:hypothetical protein